VGAVGRPGMSAAVVVARRGAAVLRIAVVESGHACCAHCIVDKAHTTALSAVVYHMPGGNDL